MFLKLFPIWAPLAALTGYLCAPAMNGWGGAIVPLLTVVMLCMGLTLKPADFVAVGNLKKAFALGMVLQFSVMPLGAVLVSMVFGLDAELTVGMVLVGSVAGGTSSNVITYLARGNVALSVSMTACSTLASVVLTPLLLSLLVGSKVDVPAGDMLLSLFRIVLVPVVLGVAINHWAGKLAQRLQPAMAPLSVIAILIIIAIVVALSAGNLRAVALTVVFATLAHNVLGMLLGFYAARLLGFDKVICRTIGIEVGMQNSGLATALALKFFTPISALPGAIFSIWLNITGSIFASYCVHADERSAGKAAKPASY
jgi:BASS family bile acid:Na+ symporter